MGLFRKSTQSKLTRKLSRKARRYRRRWFRRIFWLTILVSISGVGAIGYRWYSTTPDLSSVFVSKNNTKLFTKQLNIKYLNSDGKLFYQTNESNFREAKVSEVKSSKTLVHALVATEDRDFFKEKGVNWLHTAKAVVDTVLDHGVSGGSTITQQLIKLAFYSTSKKDQTVRRKFQEILLAEQLSSKYSKYQVLTWYFNKTNYGNGQQGIVAAAKYYYGKTPDQLSVTEAATLVGIVNSPSLYNPYTKKANMMKRRNIVLCSMREAGYITKSQYRQYSKLSIDTGLIMAKKNVQSELASRTTKLKYNGFVSGVNAQLSRYSTQLTQSTLTVKTTMNQSLQDQVNNIVAKQTYPDSSYQEAIVVLDNKTGGVSAISGGRATTVLGGYSRAFNVQRSSGSAIKPLLDYAPAFDLLGYNANTKLDDTKFNYPGTKTQVHDWDNRYLGKMTIRQALVQSRNVPAVRTLAAVGLNNGKQALKSLGLPSTSLYYAHAIGLDTSPLALASAYSSLANGGVRSAARFVDSVTNPTSGTVMQAQTKSTRVFTPQTSYLITDILKGVFETGGTGVSAKISGITQAGKTGTVGTGRNDGSLTDGWMVGYTKSYTVAVWVGYDNPYDKTHVLTDDNEKVAQDLYKSVMTKASQIPGTDNSDWSAPSGVNPKIKTINAGTDLTNNFTQTTNRLNTYVPFYVTKTPETLLGVPATMSKSELYEHVNNN